MADPLSAAVVLRALEREGLTVVEHRSWRMHNRNSQGAWGPVHGVMIHHTVTSGVPGSVDLCYDGRPDLPGPLCHGVIDKEGQVHLVGHGRANHAGSGDDDVLRAVIAEQYGERPPSPNEQNTDGNARFYGFECINRGDGEDPWPAAQLDAIERASAALCREHGWGAKSVIGHLEWTNQKIDPRGFSMGGMRERIAGRLGGELPEDPPKLPVVDLSQLIAAARTDPPKQGTPVSYAGVKTVEVALVDAGLLAEARLDGHFGSDTVAAYAAWQRSPAGGGYRGADADGIPGLDSLTRLGAQYGFDVKG